MAVFQKEQKVRFADTDYAGIIFYPRYFEMVNALVEDWFAEGLGVSFQTLIGDNHGAPIVGVETQFHAPFRIGDTATFDLTATRVGEKSVTLDIKAKHNGALMISSMLTVVHARRDMTGADPWPASVREKMHAYLKETGDDA